MSRIKRGLSCIVLCIYASFFVADRRCSIPLGFAARPSRLPHFCPNARAARDEPPARAMTSVTWMSSGERPRRFQVPHREGSPPDQFDPERGESPMIAILDSIAVALAAPDGEAT